LRTGSGDGLLSGLKGGIQAKDGTRFYTEKDNQNNRKKKEGKRP